MAKLTKDQQKKIADKMTLKSCQVCGSTTWTISSRLFDLLPYEPGTRQLDASPTPAAMVICEGCGQMVLLSVVRLGFYTNPAT